MTVTDSQGQSSDGHCQPVTVSVNQSQSVAIVTDSVSDPALMASRAPHDDAPVKAPDTVSRSCKHNKQSGGVRKELLGDAVTAASYHGPVSANRKHSLQCHEVPSYHVDQQTSSLSIHDPTTTDNPTDRLVDSLNVVCVLCACVHACLLVYAPFSRQRTLRAKSLWRPSAVCALATSWRVSDSPNACPERMLPTSVRALRVRTPRFPLTPHAILVVYTPFAGRSLQTRLLCVSSRVTLRVDALAREAATHGYHVLATWKTSYLLLLGTFPTNRF